MCFEGYYACIFYDKEDLIKALNLKKKKNVRKQKIWYKMTVVVILLFHKKKILEQQKFVNCIFLSL